MHVTIGCGGKPGVVEALDDVEIQTECSSSPFNSTKDWSKKLLSNPTQMGIRACPTVQPLFGGFCWSKGQPSISAMHTAAYGYGTLDILNATHASWAFYRNVDAFGKALETVVINRALPKSCASVAAAGRR